ncbi:MAG: hypothetical protein EOP91_06505, partial [Lysobacteraceae bacterium]
MNSENVALVADYGQARPALQDLANDPSVAVLSASECELFALVGRARPVATGEVLFSRGDAGNSMFVILQGVVAL